MANALERFGQRFMGLKINDKKPNSKTSNKILTTNETDLWTTKEMVGDSLSEGEIVCIPWGGNPIVQYYKGKFITGDNRIATSFDIDVLSNKYLYYCLLNKLVDISSFYRGSGIKHPDMSKVLNIEIPLPPLPVQEEIVRILDTFSELEAELEAERIQRIKQYDYCRNLLLDFGNPEIINLSHTIFEQVRKLCPNGVEYKKLSDVCFKITDGMHNLPKTITTDGKYPIISAQNINNGYISLNTSKYVDEKTFILENKRTNVKKNDVLLTIVGAIGRVAKVSSDMEVLLQRSVCVLKPNPNILDSQFLKYVLESEQPQKYIKNYAHGAAQKGIYLDNVSKIKIPIPPIEIQKEIVKILDHLSGLCNNVVMGIPAEINSRRMQYEYYRNVLLSFDNSVVAGTEQNRTEQNRTEQIDNSIVNH